MSLALQSWQGISIHEVVAEFLLGERQKPFQADVLLRLPPNQVRAVEKPNTADPSENHFRLRLLLYFRAQLIGEIPPDTQWFEVRSLGDDELTELRIIARCGLDDLAQNNELAKVAKNKIRLTNAPATWRKPILWGHDQAGPFTILEGNHRLVAYAAGEDNHSLSIPVLIGLSPTPCFFHGPDPPHKLANDLWKEGWPWFQY